MLIDFFVCAPWWHVELHPVTVPNNESMSQILSWFRCKWDKVSWYGVMWMRLKFIGHHTGKFDHRSKRRLYNEIFVKELDFLHDRSRISLWTKSISNSWDNIFVSLSWFRKCGRSPHICTDLQCTVLQLKLTRKYYPSWKLFSKGCVNLCIFRNL